MQFRLMLSSVKLTRVHYIFLLNSNVIFTFFIDGVFKKGIIELIVQAMKFNEASEEEKET
jgi:hypothetical protein